MALENSSRRCWCTAGGVGVGVQKINFVLICGVGMLQKLWSINRCWCTAVAGTSSVAGVGSGVGCTYDTVLIIHDFLHCRSIRSGRVQKKRVFLRSPLASSLRRPSILCGQLYHQSAVMMLQQLVDNWIMDSEGDIDTPPVVRVTEFPSPEFSDDGFWSSVSRGDWRVPAG